MPWHKPKASGLLSGASEKIAARDMRIFPGQRKLLLFILAACLFDVNGFVGKAAAGLGEEEEEISAKKDLANFREIS